MKALRSWRLEWILSCLSVGLLLLGGCDPGGDDDQVSHIRMFLETQADVRSEHAYPQALVLMRQTTDPLSVSRILVDVFVPEDNASITAEVTDITGSDAYIELAVPQGPGRHIQVDAFNASGEVLYRGDTFVDLFLAVHDVEIVLAPVTSSTSP